MKTKLKTSIVLALIVFLSEHSLAQFSLIHNGSNFGTITKFIVRPTTLKFSSDSKVAEIDLNNDSINVIHDFQIAGCNQSDFHIFNDSVYYFLAHNSCQFNLIHKSSDNGINWQVISINSNDQQQLIMFNDTSGILSDNNNYILRTNNGCLSFDTLFQPNIINAFKSNSFSDSIATFNANNHYYFSKNRGVNWNTYNFGFDSKVESTNFLNKDTFFVCGKLFTQSNPNPTNTKLYYSYNGGNTIDSLFIPIGSHIIYDIAFLNNTEAYAVAYSLTTQKNVIIKTTNFFNTVQVIETPYSAPDILLQKIKFINDSIAYIGGYYGEIVKWNKNHTNVGIKEQTTNTLFSIYPNPATNQLNIQLNSEFNTQNSKLNMYDKLGNEVLNQTIKNQTTTLNIEHLTKGIYTIKISNETKAQLQKIIIQ